MIQSSSGTTTNSACVSRTSQKGMGRVPRAGASAGRDPGLSCCPHTCPGSLCSSFLTCPALPCWCCCSVPCFLSGLIPAQLWGVPKITTELSAWQGQEQLLGWPGDEISSWSEFLQSGGMLAQFLGEMCWLLYFPWVMQTAGSVQHLLQHQEIFKLKATKIIEIKMLWANKSSGRIVFPCEINGFTDTVVFLPII